MMPRWRGCMPASPARLCPASRKRSEPTRGQPMPRFAANLSMMFNEVPLLDRFDAAAKAGFTAVEFLFPYDHPPEAIGERLRHNGLTQALFNLPPGNWDAGEKGFAALPDRFGDLQQSLHTALPYAQATGVKRLHLMAGIADRGDRKAVDAVYKSKAWAAEFFGPHGLDVVIEPINPRNVPGYFLNDFSFASDLFDELDRLGYSGFVGCEYNPRGRTTDGLGWFKPYAGVKP